MKYLKNLGIALSQVLHAALGGSAKMTTSARIGKHAYRGERWALALDWLLSRLLFDPRHTFRAWDKDQTRTRCAHDAKTPPI